MPSSPETGLEDRLRRTLKHMPVDEPVRAPVVTRAIQRGRQLRRVRRAAFGAVPVLAAAVVAAIALSITGTMPDAGDSGPAGGPGAKDWQRARQSPLSARANALVLASGSTIVVLGGEPGSCPPNAGCLPTARKFQLRDGAEYDLDTNRWRRIADAPEPLSNARAVTSGGIIYVLTERSAHPDTNPQILLSYSLADDRWTRLTSPPEPVDDLALAGTSHLVGYQTARATGQRSGEVFDLSSNTWSELPADPLPNAEDRRFVATDTGEVVLFAAVAGPRFPEFNPEWRAAAWNPSTQRWREFPPSGIVDSEAHWYWLDGRLVNPSSEVVEDAKGSFRTGGTLDPATAQWGPPPPAAPERPARRAGPEAAGEHWVVQRTRVLDVRTWAWASVPEPPSAFPDQDSTAVIAQGRVVAFGGASLESTGMPALTNDTWILRLG